MLATAVAPPDKEKAQAAKQKGNEAFAKKDWADAVGHYTVAHYADPTEPTYPLNRAMAYIKLEKFADAERDCTTALTLSPNNVKALYRKATAQVGADKLEPAIQNYEAVLRLDPKNFEAKQGLAKARKALEEAKSKKREEPIDLRGLGTGLQPGTSQTSSHSTEGTAQKAQESSNSVEAARKFLQQVGMSNDSHDERAAVSTPKLSTSVLPAKFPGETGGLLREVTTRKTEAKPLAQQDIAKSSHPIVNMSAPPITSAPAPLTGSLGSSARKTASALNFGASSSSSVVAPPAQQQRRKPQTPPGKVSAIEFHRRWKNKNSRLDLLLSTDPESIPVMFDAMLEPELVAEMLQTLVEQRRSAADDARLSSLIADVLQALPRCKRFGMTVSMLDSTEKGYAQSLIEAVGRPDLKSVWEVS